MLNARPRAKVRLIVYILKCYRVIKNKNSSVMLMVRLDYNSIKVVQIPKLIAKLTDPHIVDVFVVREVSDVVVINFGEC